MSILEVIKIDKKKIFLLILTVFWLFMLKRPKKEDEYIQPERAKLEKGEEMPILNYEGLMSRKEIKLQIDGNIFEGTGSVFMESQLEELEEVDEKELIREEMGKIIFLGYISEGKTTLFLEYSGEFYEILNGEEIEVRGQDNSLNVRISLENGKNLTFYESQNKIIVTRDI